MNIVQQIHEEFFTAADRLVAEAAQLPDLKQKAETLNKLGFTRAKEVKDSLDYELKKEQARLVNYYLHYYPLNRFITEDQVQEICKKYNLVYGPAELYKGEIPDIKLRQIDIFELRKEDELWELQARLDKHSPWNSELRQNPSLIQLLFLKINKYAHDWMLFGTIYQYRLAKKSLIICAPVQEMHTDNLWRLSEGSIQYVQDPVVLQPVIGGYLIITAWGEEAADENVVNSICQ